MEVRGHGPSTDDGRPFNPYDISHSWQLKVAPWRRDGRPASGPAQPLLSCGRSGLPGPVRSVARSLAWYGTMMFPCCSSCCCYCCCCFGSHRLRAAIGRCSFGRRRQLYGCGWRLRVERRLENWLRCRIHTSLCLCGDGS